MNFPFTTEQFFDVFGKYNNSTWIFMIIFYVFAIVSLYLIYKKSEKASKVTLALLAILWLWMGIIYHIVFFSTINKAAYLFGGLFIVEGLLLIPLAFKQEPLFRFNKNLSEMIGLLLIIFSLIIYPIIGFMAGHSYPNAPLFGAPCPTTIFTFGIFLLSEKKFSKYLLIIPFLWAVIGTFAALSLDVPQDYMLPVSALISTALLFFRGK